MPLLDQFHPSLHHPRRWEGFFHAWPTLIARQLNKEMLPPGYYAEPEISIGPEFEIDVAAMELGRAAAGGAAVWSPPRPEITAHVDFSHLEGYEVRVYQELGGGAERRGAIELVSPANKDRPGTRRTFAAKCAGYLRNGIGVVTVDVVTARPANMHLELFDVLEAEGQHSRWASPTGLSAVAYRAVTDSRQPRVEVWPTPLAIGAPLPVVPLWLSLDLCVPLRLEESYVATCGSLRIAV
jgi:hypothetical protein